MDLSIIPLTRFVKGYGSFNPSESPLSLIKVYTSLVNFTSPNRPLSQPTVPLSHCPTVVTCYTHLSPTVLTCLFTTCLFANWGCSADNS